MKIDDMKVSGDDLEDLLSKSPWVESPIFRGSSLLKKNNVNSLILNIPNTGFRTKPKDTATHLHDAINKETMKDHGYMLRNGLFATRDIRLAGEFNTNTIIVVPLANSTVFGVGYADFTEEVTYHRMTVEYTESLLPEYKKEHPNLSTEDAFQVIYSSVTQEQVFKYMAEMYSKEAHIAEPSDTSGEELMIFGEVLLIDYDYATSKNLIDL